MCGGRLTPARPQISVCPAILKMASLPAGHSLYRASQKALASQRAAEALELIDQALQVEPRNPLLWVHRGQCLLAQGRIAEARDAAAAARQHAPPNATLLSAIGGLFNLANDQAGALAAFDAAVALAPENAQLLYNRAAVRRYVGQLAEAEADYDRVIALNPNDCEAYLNRAGLRTQTGESNHLAEIEALLAAGVAKPQGEVFLRYALAKEYEDLKDYARSFAHLKKGAQLRRQHLRYDVAVDVATVDWIIEAFPHTQPVSFGSAAARASNDAPINAPIFIVGMPRSGSTLIDRILGSHSQVYSAGELHAFAVALVDAVRRRSGKASLPRQELVALSADVDFAALGSNYVKLASSGVPAGMRFTDKMPLNYLYLGLIRRALPHAKIIHVSRAPMAAVYAMYKMLFQDGYPFSYDLTELGKYYVSYRRLMDHWRKVLPGAIYDLAYEDLVADQIGETRKALEFCGLDWEDACADFHLNAAAATTASASQVRQPIYSESISQWRHYAGELTELSAVLRAGGIETES
jgi:tetratricopeptide (TPR) repeat protein